MLRVMRKHQLAAKKLALVPKTLKKEIDELWQTVLRQGELFGFRNAQATVIAPTGTIGLVMDCETTGIEPDYSLIKYKSLVGGGQLITENKAVRSGLQHLGYAAHDIEKIIDYIKANNSIIGAPTVDKQHYGVFATAVGDNVIAPAGHLKMMAAVQPFISGAISKTVNLPHTFSQRELSDLYFQAWKMGLKSIAIYRDGSKFVQPLTDKPSTIVADTEKAQQAPSGMLLGAAPGAHPKCGVCGFETILDGGCFKCLNCGSTTACAG